MHRTFIALGVAALVCGHATAGPIPCQRIEYAQLKDSTKKELSEEYCSANRKAVLNKDLADIRKSGGLQNQKAERDARELTDAQIACLEVADSAAKMLSKKFKSKAPNCS